ncbi:MAG: 3,4-dihydroxy-2-butanone-4-phosphate synthase [Flavobacteriales bacterium]|nr:3,4-dihydroxy-2-butanone-4-phosphate synthase [Flavobacteriales bacterium]
MEVSAMPNTQLNTIESALEDIRLGKVVIVVDDEDRENEGDFLTAARNVTPEVINFMSKHGRGLICAALTAERCDELRLDMMVNQNTDPRKTAFTVSVDLLGHGCTTGISAHDRAKTVQALIDPTIQAEDLARPGHIFPLKAKQGGVLRRAGHTEATIDLARLAGMEPAGVLVEIMNDDGTMARLPDLVEIARQFDLKIITIKDLIAYRLRTEHLLEKIAEVPMDTVFGQFRMVVFRHLLDKKEHIALVKGHWTADESVLVRVHSGHTLGDLFGATAGGHAMKLQRALQQIDREGKGVLVFINHLQEGLWEEVIDLKRSLDQSDAPEVPGKKPDNRDFGTGAQILRDLGVHKMTLLTSHSVKRSGIEGFGLEITSTRSLDM